MICDRGVRSAYQDQNASRKPNQEKKNTLPYWSTGFRKGTDLAFLVMGLISGACHSEAILKPILCIKVFESRQCISFQVEGSDALEMGIVQSAWSSSDMRMNTS